MSKKDSKAKDIKSAKVEPPRPVVFEYFESFAVTLIMALFGMTFVIQAVTVPTGSMQNTILVGDYLLVNKFIFNAGGNPLPFLPQRDIERGDIIVFKYPGNKVDPSRDQVEPYKVNYVKRVIGLPGETIEFREAKVYINGKLLPENRVEGRAPAGDGKNGNFVGALDLKRRPEEMVKGAEWDVFYGKSFDEMDKDSLLEYEQAPTRYYFGQKGKTQLVPPNHFFVMGDSRDNSEDSRVWGFVPRELIVGRAMFVYWSCDRFKSDGSALGCLTNPRFNRIGKFIK